MAWQHSRTTDPPTKITLRDLGVIAARLDVSVHVHHLEHGLLGFYEPTEARVYLAMGLTPREMRCTLAHELGHVYYGHTCHGGRHERQAWTFAADLLIDVQEYARLEREGHTLHDIAEELDVTEQTVRAFRDHHLQRLGHTTYGRRIGGHFTNAIARALA